MTRGAETPGAEDAAGGPAPEGGDDGGNREGFRNFLLMWSGQVVSLIGSGLTAFAVGVWVYQETGNVTLFTLIAAFGAVPAVFLAPVAGVLVDRFSRKLMLIVSDSGAAVASLGLLLLFHFGVLELWHIYLLVMVNAAFSTIQFPAFSAAVTMLIPKQHFGRASGLMQFGQAGSQILAPLIAGFLMVVISVSGIIAVDLATFVFAIVLLAVFVHIPRPKAAEEEEAVGPDGRGPSFWKQLVFGWDYIKERPGLLSLLVFFAAFNMVVPMAMVLATPLVLSFAGPDELGIVMSVSSVGLLVGGFTMGIWGGPKRRIAGILGVMPLMAVGLVLAGWRPSVPLIAAGMFVAFLAVPIAESCSQAIWQSKVAPAVQGRVFSMRSMVSRATAPLAFLLAGPLSEQIFVPLLRPGGALADSVGAVLGTGEGRGIGLLFMVLAAALVLAAAVAAAYPRLRNLEDVIPDAVPDTPPPGAAEPAEPGVAAVPPPAEEAGR